MTTAVDERREQFKQDVAALGLGTTSNGSGGKGRIAGMVLMIIGVAAAFVVYIASLTLSDLRDIASYQLLSMGFIALTLVGAAVYVASVVAKVLRLWLVRQLLEGNAQTERIVEAMSLERSVIVAAGSAAAELAEHGGERPAAEIEQAQGVGERGHEHLPPAHRRAERADHREDRAAEVEEQLRGAGQPDPGRRLLHGLETSWK